MLETLKMNLSLNGTYLLIKFTKSCFPTKPIFSKLLLNSDVSKILNQYFQNLSYMYSALSKIYEANLNVPEKDKHPAGPFPTFIEAAI